MLVCSKGTLGSLAVGVGGSKGGSQMSLLGSAAQTVIDECALGLEEKMFSIGDVMTRAADYLRCEAVSIFRLDRGNNELVLRYAMGPSSPAIVGLRIPVGRGVVGWVVQYGEDLIVPETVRDPRFYAGVDEKTGFVTRSILCVPMFQSAQVIGAVEAMNKTSGRFNDEDMLFLQEIADVVADYG
jgi:GAF domain-containing protein